MFLDDLVDENNSEGAEKEAKRLVKQKQEEEIRTVHRRARIVTNDFLGAPYRMELSTQNGSHFSSDKDAMERALIAEYEAKYRLANSSPFLHEPLKLDLGPLAINAKAKQIIDGTYDIPQGVKNLKMDDALIGNPLNPVVINVDDSNKFWQKMKEKVSSSPSTRHIGTYKAAVHIKVNSKIQAEMISIPFET